MPNTSVFSLKPQDVLVACRLCVGGVATQAVLADRLRMSSSTVWKSLQRLKRAKFFTDNKIDRRKLFDLLVHGVPMFFAARKTSLVRGIPTGTHSPLWKDRFGSVGLPMVWPYGRGKEVGEGLKPIYPSVPSACALDDDLYEVMATVEILRVGLSREREAAEKYLREKLKVEGSATPGSATPGSATRACGPPGSATPGSATPGSETPGSATRACGPRACGPRACGPQGLETQSSTVGKAA